MTIIFDPAAFRLVFPEYADPAAYPDATLSARWNGEATLYVDVQGMSCLADAKRLYASNLMLAHLLRLSAKAVAAGPGQTAGVVTGAAIEKVSVQLMPPPAKDGWAYWLNQTPYGQQFIAFLQGAAVGGFMVGGLPERSAFRKVGGVF